MVNNGIHSVGEIFPFSQCYVEIGDLKYNNFVFGKFKKVKFKNL